MQRVHFIRHGLSEANVLFYAGKVQEARDMLDPALAPKGEEQARDVATDPLLADALAMPRGDGDGDGDEDLAAQLLVVSPLRRTVQTARLAFAPWLAARAAAGAPVNEPAAAAAGGTTDGGRAELLPVFFLTFWRF